MYLDVMGITVRVHNKDTKEIVNNKKKNEINKFLRAQPIIHQNVVFGKAHGYNHEILFTIHYSLFTLHYSFFIVHYSFFIVHFSFFIILMILLVIYIVLIS